MSANERPLHAANLARPLAVTVLAVMVLATVLVAAVLAPLAGPPPQASHRPPTADSALGATPHAPSPVESHVPGSGSHPPRPHMESATPERGTGAPTNAPTSPSPVATPAGAPDVVVSDTPAGRRDESLTRYHARASRTRGQPLHA